MKSLNGLVAILVNIVANVAPWIAPLPTAWLIYDRTMVHLRWPAWVAIAAGVTLELLGVAILATTLELYNYNHDKRKSDPVAPVWIGLILVGVYAASAILLVVILDIAPGVAIYSQAVYPALSVASFALLALRTDHERRVSEIAVQKADAKDKRARKRAEKTMQKAQAGVAPVQLDATQTKTERVRILAAQRPGWSHAKLAQEVGCSASTVSRALH